MAVLSKYFRVVCLEKLLPAIIVLLVCPAWLSFDTLSAAVELLFSFPDPYVPYDLPAIWKGSTCDSRFLDYHKCLSKY